MHSFFLRFGGSRDGKNFGSGRHGILWQSFRNCLRNLGPPRLLLRTQPRFERIRRKIKSEKFFCIQCFSPTVLSSETSHFFLLLFLSYFYVLLPARYSCGITVNNDSVSLKSSGENTLLILRFFLNEDAPRNISLALYRSPRSILCSFLNPPSVLTFSYIFGATFFCNFSLESISYRGGFKYFHRKAVL